jgi:hypothetical protein
MNRKFIIDGIVVDERSLEEAKEIRINDLREQTTSNIVEKEGIDNVTQMNAALGVYDPERTEEILSKIVFWRNKFLQAKEAIGNATTKEEVDNINL